MVFFMRNLTVHTRINRKNTIYLRLSLIALLGWGLFLAGYILQPVYAKAVNGIISTYHTTFSSEEMENKEPFAAIADSGSTENDIMEEAKALKQERNQEVTVVSYQGATALTEESNTENKLNYKAETTSEGIKMSNFYHNENVQSDTTLSRQWDVSENEFDLVSGVLTIQLTIEEGLSTLDILTQSKGLIGLLMTYNAEKEISSIDLEIKSGKQNYFFDSNKLNTLVSTKMIYSN